MKINTTGEKVDCMVNYTHKNHKDWNHKNLISVQKIKIIIIIIKKKNCHFVSFYDLYFITLFLISDTFPE